MTLDNIKIYGPDFKFHNGSVSFSGEKIADVRLDDSETDSEFMLIPGFIDLHFHGCAGYDFTDGTKEAIEKMAEYEAKNGITAICPSTMPVPDSQLKKALAAAAEYNGENGAELVGINMEGPYLTFEKRGGNDANYLKNPSITEFNEFRKAAKGKIKIIDIAPDMPGSTEFIKEVSKSTVVSLAHTPADYNTAMKGFEAGASLVTHLFNGMSAFSHRETGLAGAAMDFGAYVELICDGRHVSDTMLRAAYKIFGEEKIVIISDSLSCTGLADGTIAGASNNLFEGFRHLVKCGIPLESAVRMASYNPAKILGVSERLGTIEPGKTASLVMIDKELNIRTVYLKGKKIL